MPVAGAARLPSSRAQRSAVEGPRGIRLDAATGSLRFGRDDRLFRRALLRWYRQHGRDLPWRRTRDPYAILVSELMLQQTQVATVSPYYERWLRRFPTFASLASAAESDVLHAWQGLGYYARARNLHAAAKAVIDRHGGVFPRNPSESISLPGVGRYTANAVATFAFGDSVPIVEANTARLFARLLNLQSPVDSSAGQQQLWDFATILLPRENATVHNSALMDLGALVCVSGQPKCEVCPIRPFCRATNPATLPIKRARASLKLLAEYHQFAATSGVVLLEQSRARWKGMWILPPLPGEPPGARLLYAAEFPFTHHRVTLRVCEAPHVGNPTTEQRYFRLDELDTIPMPSPHRRALESLLRQRDAAQQFRVGR